LNETVTVSGVPGSTVVGTDREVDAMPKTAGTLGVSLFRVTARVAVKVTVLVAVCPIVVAANESWPGAADSGWSTGEPKPITRPLPSPPLRVPTYTALPSTAGGANFVAVPIGALHRRCILPLTGTASYARSCALAPLLSACQMTQPSAEPVFVPSEVTTAV